NVHLNLVANNKEIIFITSDNFSNNSANILIMQSQSVINSVIGSANYDIGHTFSTGAGGLASLASVCSANFKAQGITGASSPVGDAYGVDYVATKWGIRLVPIIPLIMLVSGTAIIQRLWKQEAAAPLCR